MNSSVYAFWRTHHYASKHKNWYSFLKIGFILVRHYYDTIPSPDFNVFPVGCVLIESSLSFVYMMD